MTSVLAHDGTVDDRAEALMVDERMKALGSVYQLADSVLSGEKVTVNVGRAAHSRIPAWTTGSEIFINTSAIGAEDFDSIVRMHGLNFHELSHVLYTPRAGTKLAQYCIENGLMSAFNLLEDQRIESMLTAKYPSTAPWLTAAVMRWVVEDPQALSRGYLFVRGRRYLPGDLRGLMRQMFERRDLLPDVDRVIDSYRRLVFPTDYDAAKPLIEKMQDILSQFGGVTRDPNGHSENEFHVCDKGRPAPVREQRDLRDKMGDESSDTEESDGDEPTVPGDAKPGRSQSEQDFDDEQPQDIDSPLSSDQPGTGSGTLDENAAREIIENMLEEVLASKEVRDDVRRTQKAMDRASGAQILPTAKYQIEQPDEKYILIERRLTQILESLREEAEPGWHRREDFGRLNTVRWAIERDPTEAFDRWDEGVTEAVDIEAVLMLDVSGSMGAAMWEVHNAMWALKRAFDAVDISSTVIVYDGISEILYSNQERATTTLRYAPKGGGTDPVDGLNQASRIFAASQRSNKILVVLTDGQWPPTCDEFGMEPEDYISRMNDEGVLTCLGYIPLMVWREEDLLGLDIESLVQENRHRCKIAGLARSQSLVPFIGDIVTGLVRSRMRSAR